MIINVKKYKESNFTFFLLVIIVEILNYKQIKVLNAQIRWSYYQAVFNTKRFEFSQSNFGIHELSSGISFNYGQKFGIHLVYSRRIDIGANCYYWMLFSVRDAPPPKLSWIFRILNSFV